jgi:hypothetical protein
MSSLKRRGLVPIIFDKVSHASPANMVLQRSIVLPRFARADGRR